MLFRPSLVSNLVIALASDMKPRVNNGLAPTPPMGWNSYNHYSCSPNESIIHSNAQAVVSLGLASLGYNYVTVDCGWALPDRTAQGTMAWDPVKFPAGFPALGTYLHGLGLKFGVYSDAGIEMCDNVAAGSLYDNCYSDASLNYPQVSYEPSTSPKPNFITMGTVLSSISRPILYSICEWGVDFPAAWAPSIGNSWRIANDISGSYSSISRILNQAVPQTSFGGPEHWLDLDMLEVGNNVYTTAEEQTHFSLWAILKSPLIIGADLENISAASLAILSNEDVIGYNQDDMGVPASFKRRWTTDGYEVWAGPLSGNRTVVAVINLSDAAQTLTLNFPDMGLQKAGTVKNIWAGTSATDVVTSYSGDIAAHGTMLLELGDTVEAGIYDVDDAVVSGSTIAFSKIYAQTSSANYSAVVHFTSSALTTTTFTISPQNKTYTLAANAPSFTIPALTFTAGNSDALTIVSSSTLLPSSLTINPSPSTYYPSTAMTLSGSAVHVTCEPGFCEPTGAKIGYISQDGEASLSINAPLGISTGPKYLTLYFCNNDISFASTSTNTRNITISINGITTRAEVPLSGKSSELTGTMGWQDTGLFGLLTTGWKEGSNVLVFGNEVGGIQVYAPDLVGVGIAW